MLTKLKYLILCTLLNFCQLALSAQQVEKTDTLILNNVRFDTTYVTSLFTLMNEVYEDRPLKAMQYCLKAKEVSEKINYQRGKSEAYSWLGFLFQEQGQLEEALNYNHRSLKMQEALNDKKGMASTLNNIGSIYMDLGRRKEELYYYRRALKIHEEIGNKQGIAVVLNNIGLTYNNLRKDNEALTYYFRSLKISEELDNKNGIATALTNIGAIKRQQGLNNEAMHFLNRALDILEKTGNKRGISYIKVNLGKILFAEKKNKEAKKYTLSSLALAKEIRNADCIRNAEILLSKIDSAGRNFAGAFEHYKLYILYRDSINNENTRKAGTKSQLKYEFEKKEAVLKEQQDKERAVAAEKDRFQQIVIASVMAGLFLVLVFAAFVFRSLKTTRKQKVIIEEKQKEILDSIYYAKRIQKSLLPTDKYIDKNLKLLRKPDEKIA